jgi:hypothetical protein
MRQADAISQGERIFRKASWTGAAIAGTLLTDITGNVGMDWKHEESTYDDFSRSPLLFHMTSVDWPAI